MSVLEQLKLQQHSVKLVKQRAEEAENQRKRDEIDRIQRIEQLSRSLELELQPPPKKTRSSSSTSSRVHASAKTSSGGKGNPTYVNNSQEKPKRRVAMTFEELQAASTAKKLAAEELKKKEQAELAKSASRPVSRPQKSSGPSLFIPKKSKHPANAPSNGSSKDQIKKEIINHVKDKTSLQPLQKSKRDLDGVGDILEQRASQKAHKSSSDQDWRAQVRGIFHYDPSKFARQDSQSDSDMEVSGHQILAEERRSRKLAIQEDLEADKETERLEKLERERKRKRH
jgi:hypothetical protein